MKTQNKVYAAVASLALLLYPERLRQRCRQRTFGHPHRTGPEGHLRGRPARSEGCEPPAAVVQGQGRAHGRRGPALPADGLPCRGQQTPIGLNPDITRLIAKKLDVKVKFVDTKFDTIIPGLDGGRFDFTVSTMAKTDERLKVVDMIDYFKAGSSIGVNAGNPQKLTNETLCGKNIAVTQGSTGQLLRLPALNERPALQGTAGDQRRDAAQHPGGPGPAALQADRRHPLRHHRTRVGRDSSSRTPSTMLTPPLNVGGTGLTAVALKKGSELTPAIQAAVQSILAEPGVQGVPQDLGTRIRGHHRSQAQLAGRSMITAISKGSKATMGSIDAALKPGFGFGPRSSTRGGSCSILVGIGILTSVLDQPQLQVGHRREVLLRESILRGLMLTIFLTVASMALGTLLGLALAIMRSSKVKPVALAAGLYITLFRGTPVLVQLIFWFNIAALYPNLTIGIPFTDIGTAIDMNALMGPITAALVGLTLNEGAYMAEIIRGGFSSVGKGQIEAADSLGMSAGMKMRKVIIPQAMPSIIPATGNQVIGMFKGTSLVSVLGVAELLQSAQLIYARTFDTIPLLIVASLWYLVMTLLLSYPQSKLEEKYSRATSRLPRKAKKVVLTEPEGNLR